MMVNNHSVVEQAHEVQCIIKDLDLLKCPIPDKFVAGCIIAKLPFQWRNFATILKHKRQEISVENLIASLDVKEKVGLRMLRRKKARVLLALMWCIRTTHTARTRRQSTSLPRLLPSKRRRIQTSKELASRAVKGDTSQEIVQIILIARQRFMDQEDPKMST